jgi:hypothetical protein
MRRSCGRSLGGALVHRCLPASADVGPDGQPGSHAGRSKTRLQRTLASGVTGPGGPFGGHGLSAVVSRPPGGLRERARRRPPEGSGWVPLRCARRLGGALQATLARPVEADRRVQPEGPAGYHLGFGGVVRQRRASAEGRPPPARGRRRERLQYLASEIDYGHQPRSRPS